ncbi:hypothetical protein Acr_15g0017600 [Actinidia rufa]|uniref:Disease resistance R13L4/SHOC-2-like LRR domain-containing protein n=1 Tax=Actinidia rufa TaxID=165716 RepID=A0A7J0FWT0_9ERIC|nr:hypothetical protein Acr_15g0017600 [Actinidia rufa]
MSTREAAPSSDDTPSIHNSRTHSKSKWSIRSWVAHVKAKRRISKPKLFENNHNTASNTSDNDDHHDGALALSKLIRQDFDFMEEEIAKVKNYVDHVDGQIIQACQNFKELQTRGSRERELREVKKAVAKLKSQIPSQLRIHSADSNPHRKSWPDINESSGEMMQLYMKPKSERTKNAGISELVNEEDANKDFECLIGMGLIEPVYQKCSLVPDSCRMPLSVRSALSLSDITKKYVNTSKYNTGGITEFHRGGFSYLINVDNAIIDGKLLEKGTDFNTRYLGRWQSSATHHIEVADNKVLHGLKNMKRLRFLSLRGISMIKELPAFISELKNLKILDLKACHNLEVVPDGIGSLFRLTHLDMSECYFLENMPRSLSKLSRLEVLKGFFIGDSNNNRRSCTLEDLSKLQKLRKLNIYTGVKDFPEGGQLIVEV